MIKKIKYIITTLIISFLVFQAIIYSTGFQYLNPAIWHNFPNINDHELFFNRTIKKSAKSKKWETKLNSKYTSLPKSVKILETTSLVVIKNDTLVFEQYASDYLNQEPSNSFSMAKSYVSALIGCAIQDSLILSINDPVGNYLKGYPFSIANFR